MKTKFLILGAGPSGLSFAESLLRNGESDFVLIEKEREPGGLCRSKEVDGAPLDICGGHFLDVRRPTGGVKLQAHCSDILTRLIMHGSGCAM